MFSPPATPTNARIVVYRARRYNETNGPQHALALGFMGLINMANTFQLETDNPELAQVSWLARSVPHEPDLVPAVAEVIEHLQQAH